MQIAPKTIDWLMEGDPAIRWQVMRDLLDAPETDWQAERQKVATEGWGARLLACQDADGRWGGGVYSPKWISTTYTLLCLRQLGLPRDCEAAQRGARIVIDQLLGKAFDAAFRKRLNFDHCVEGMILELCVYFGIEDERVRAIAENLLAERMADGGWNCRKFHKPYPHHSSFYTTANVLESLRDLAELRPTDPLAPAVVEAERGARELLLQHRLFRSDKTGEVIREDFVKISNLYRWRYDYLRALDIFARVDAEKDPRLEEAIDLLCSTRHADGRWPNQRIYAGKVFFTMETAREPSRINTLRALRVLKWWENKDA